MGLVVLVYEFTKTLPKEEIYGLVSQMRRCAVSIPSNIAEGWARKNTQEYINFLSIAMGSAAELDTQLTLSERLKIGDPGLLKDCQSLLVEVQKMLPSMMKSLRK